MLRAHQLYGGPVKGVDLVLGPGITVVIGEPECGTSSLLRLLAGVDPFDSGDLASGTVALLTTPPGDEWKDSDIVREAFDAPHLIGREMWTLSGGERQRVRLANLFASEAAILMLDEPVGYLDARGRAMALQALKDDPRPVLIACKSDPAVAAAADRVLTMVDGQLLDGDQTAGGS